MTPNNRYSPEEIEKISDSVSVLDYFFHLERQGKVKFERKTGHDHYFRTENNKFSVNEEKFYDFKTGNGGKIIKAVMDLENKSWREAVDFLKDFSNIEIPSQVIAEREKIKRSATNSTKSVLTSIISPNNSALLNYFQNRGIDNDIIQKNTQQVHYQVSGKKYFGIGLKNESGGYEIRNPMMKNKIGKSDISILQGTKNEAVVFEGMTDMLSFLQICKDRNIPNQRTLVVLNSGTNTGEFLEKFKNFTGKIHLILDGDKAGNEATEKIRETLKNSIDAREKYGISDGKHNDLNDYLINSFKPRLILEKNRTN